MKNQYQNFTSNQASIVIKLLSHDFQRLENIKQCECFSYGGHVFMIGYRTAVDMFAKNNPNGGDFFVWCQQNFKTLN